MYYACTCKKYESIQSFPLSNADWTFLFSKEYSYSLPDRQQYSLVISNAQCCIISISSPDLRGYFLQGLHQALQDEILFLPQTAKTMVQQIQGFAPHHP